jgi:soluble lytic murein transglycosylase-like protein
VTHIIDSIPITRVARIVATTYFAVAIVAAFTVVSNTVLAVEAPRTTPIESVTPEPEPPPDYTADCAVAPPVDLSMHIVDAAAEFGMNPWMVAVTVHQESGCDQYALGSSGEIGLAQVNPSVWMRVLRREGIARRPQELYDVRTNLRAAAYILHHSWVESDGDVFDTFRRYNGSGAKARRYAREQVAAYAAVVR